MHVVCSQETVAAADCRDDKSMGEGGCGWGRGAFGRRERWGGGGGGGVGALAVSLEVNDGLSSLLTLCSSYPSLRIRDAMPDGIDTVGFYNTVAVPMSF